jgi:phosphoglycerate dehydrogenase-like enzyme
MQPPTVLLSHLYTPEQTAALPEQFPHVDFIRLDPEPVAPSGAEHAQALLFAGFTKPDLETLLQQLPALTWIHTGSAGFDWVMVPEVERRNITISRSAGVMHIPMAEFAVGALLSHYKNLPAIAAAQTRHEWAPPMHQELHGKTIGIIGTGAVGGRVAEVLKPFGVRTIGVRRSAQPAAHFDEVVSFARLDEVLPQVDVLILACPLTPETEGLIGWRELQLMKRSAYLINLARGPVLPEADLIRALHEEVIAGACLDAFDVEPLPADSPLWDTPNALISPHCSYRTPEVRGRVISEFASNLERFLAGQPLANTMTQPALGY